MTCDDQAVRILSEFYNEPVRACLDEPVNAYEGDSNTLIAAYETQSKGVNILRVSHDLSHIAQFPDSISQIWTDGKQVYGAKEFNTTVTTRVVRCSLRMTDERLARLKAKYPDYGFVQFDEHGEWAI
jgi:ABC-type sugar transport system ATPase subunit